MLVDNSVDVDIYQCSENDMKFMKITVIFQCL